MSAIASPTIADVPPVAATDTAAGTPTDSVSLQTLSAEEVVSHFNGVMPPIGQSPLYVLGLLFVAVAMVLLPIIYLALIAATAWGVAWHLQNDSGMIVGNGQALVITFLAYLAPAVIGGVLVLFMVKPLFARRSKRDAPFPLTEADQPALFAFVRHICQLTGAPVPKAVEVDCQVNASASFRHGFWSLFMPGDLRLTIGLPLAAGMTLPQLGGVLAHEFGHFAQGMGMRLTYLIRSINAWFARVVYERDTWDDNLLDWANSGDWRVKIIFQTARGAVWLTRRILWLLMMTGHGISSFMMRQMEFDADTYETRLGGSATFATTSHRLRELSVGGQAAMHGLQESFRSRRMPDDYPAFLVGRVSDVPVDIMAKVHGGAAEEKTGWFDSHPCDRDRVAAAARLAQPGVFHADVPASAVFRDFDGLCRAATAHHYTEVLGVPMKEVNLVKTAASAAEAKQQFAIQQELAAKLGDGVMAYLLPVAARKTVPWGLVADDVAEFDSVCAQIHAQRDAATKAMEALVPLDDRGDALDLAEALAECSFQFKADDFDLTSATIAGVTKARADVKAGKESHETVLKNYHELVDTALAKGLALHAGDSRPRVEALLNVLDKLAWASPSVHRAWSLARALHLLAQNTSNHGEPYRVERHMEQLATRIEVLLAPLREPFQALEYPYDHAQGTVTLWASVFPTPTNTDNAMAAAYENAQQFMEHLAPLYVRVLGELCQMARLREVAKVVTV